MHDYQMTSNRGIGMSTNQLIEPQYYSMAHAPEWLKERQREQILEFLKSIGNSPHFKQYEEPLMEVVNFSLDSKHKYNADIMRQYVKVTENYDRFRQHVVTKVSPEFERIRSEVTK
jgi:hemerythrin